MKVFLSWSGQRSLEAARIFHEWLSRSLQALDLWLSPETEKGANWSQAIGSQLAETTVGLVFLTRDNQTSPWLHFEVGALSKTKVGRPCIVLVDLEPTDVSGPLAQFQHTKRNAADVRQLLRDLNAWVGQQNGKALSEPVLDAVFADTWPGIAKRLAAIAAAPAVKGRATRSPDDVGRETLEIVRSLRAELEAIRFSNARSEGAAVPAKAAATPRLGPEELQVLAHLERLALRGHGAPTMDTMAKELQLTMEEVGSALRALQMQDLVNPIATHDGPIVWSRTSKPF